MAHVSLRVSDEEKRLMESYARLHGANLSDVVKQAFFEKLEDELDLIDYEKALAEYRDNPVTYSLEEIEQELGLR